VDGAWCERSLPVAAAAVMNSAWTWPSLWDFQLSA